MIDALAAIEVAEAAFDLGIKWGDAAELYKLYMDIKSAGKLDLRAMSDAGKLPASVSTIARVANVVDALLKDKAQAPHIAALLASLPT